VNAAERLAKGIIANYDNPLQSSTIDVPAEVKSLLQSLGATTSDSGGEVTYYGSDPITPDRLPYGAISAISLAAKAILIAKIWKERGTFLLVLVAARAGAVGAQPYGGALILPVKVIAPGVMVMAIIYFMGTVSGAHLNPAVTWAFALRGNFPWRRVPGYIVAQAIGAFLACLFLQCTIGGIRRGATVPSPGVSDWVAVAIEGVLTLGLVSVILGTSSGARNIGTNAAIAVGGYIGIVAVWGAPVTGASMNPMRSFAPDAVGGQLSTYWIYLAGPMIGATIAVGFEYILKGRATAAGGGGPGHARRGRHPRPISPLCSSGLFGPQHGPVERPANRRFRYRGRDGFRNTKGRRSARLLRRGREETSNPTPRARVPIGEKARAKTSINVIKASPSAATAQTTQTTSATALIGAAFCPRFQGRH
jgi:aquaporin Z